jgi:HNH endonuclease
MTPIVFNDLRLPVDFWRRVVVDPQSGCWRWQSAAYTEYGQFRLENGRTIAAHRLIVLREGRDLSGKVVDHVCETKCCVNPAHLDVVTRGDNTRRFHERRKQRGILITKSEGPPPMEATVTVKLSQEDLCAWRAQAVRDKQKLSAWIRRACDAQLARALEAK